MTQRLDGGIFAAMANEVEDLNRSKGWYDEDRRFGEDMALLHSEVSETLEAYRDHKVADVTDPGNPLAKPEGVPSELADVLVRLLDTCNRYGIDLFKEWRRKMDYNWTRPYRHGGRVL